jgi:uncharacterized protein YkwD
MSRFCHFLVLAALVAPTGGCAAFMAKHEAPVDAAPVAMSAEEAAVLAATNRYREENGLGALKPDAKLVSFARQRSRDMAVRDYFAHVSPEGVDVFDLMREHKYGFWAAGENLARNSYPEGQAVTHAMDGWRKSAAHRANLLHPSFGRLGVGVAIANDGKRYITQVFAD